jgi:hypothetical protein
MNDGTTETTHAKERRGNPPVMGRNEKDTEKAVGQATLVATSKSPWRIETDPPLWA